MARIVVLAASAWNMIAIMSHAPITSLATAVAAAALGLEYTEHKAGR